MTPDKKKESLAIHPDDAKDKVFAAILKALIKMGNTPSSPKELANSIVKHKLATLGGQTPFATVSSRISQHFKRAAKHEIAPLLKKHVDQQHSRKINYSLATEKKKLTTMSLQEPSPTVKPTLRTSNDEFIPIHQHITPIVNNIILPNQSTEEPFKIKGHSFKIIKILIGNMQCYQLDDDDEIKVLRFISLNQPDDQFNNLKQGYINATHLRKAAIPVLGEGIFDTQKENVVIITKGPLESRGAWVSLHRARELIEEFEIESSVGLTKLLSDNPIDLPVNHDEFVQFEQEKSVATIPSPPTRKHAKIAPSTKHLSTSEILKSMNIQNLNLSALQQIMSVMPNLAQISPQNLHFAKTLQAYMQSLSHMQASSSAPVNDLKNILPLIDTLIPKPSIPMTPPLLSPDILPIVYPIQPTEPPMTIMVLDNVAVCIAILRKQEEGTEKDYSLMRRLDNGFINGTQLLIAGGIDTESERSMILSFEMSRVRMPNKQSKLYGTWIPSRRAQELAATCSIQHALGPFLDEDFESLFPSPLPVTRRTSHQHIAIKKEEVVDQLLTHPNNTLKMAEINTQHAPLLGNFFNTDYSGRVTIIDKSMSIKNEIESDEETDTDNDVEQVRKEMRKIRDAAIAAMEIGNSVHLDEEFTSKRRYKHSSSRRRRNRKKTRVKQEEEDEKISPYKSFNYSRNKPTGGKWSAAKMTPAKSSSVIIIKKEDVSKSKKKANPVTHTVVNEDDEDEDVDIGGSDNDDDLR